METEAFLAAVDRHLEAHLREGDRSTVGRQVAVDFFHPRTRERLANLAGGALPMYKSGVVFHAPTGTVKVKLRVPDAIAEDVISALDPPADADLTVTDKRPATTADGQILGVTHCAIRIDEASDDRIEALLAGVGRALAV